MLYKVVHWPLYESIQYMWTIDAKTFIYIYVMHALLKLQDSDAPHLVLEQDIIDVS